MVEKLPAMQETQERQLRSLGWEEQLEQERATHSILAWRPRWTEESGGSQSAGSRRVGHDSQCARVHTPTPTSKQGFFLMKVVAI